jgi:GNAT superfamily N-acetyltransferase
MKDWAHIEEVAASAPLAEGYRFELLARREVGEVIAFIDRWFPDIRVGSASGYLREDFYASQVVFEDARERDVLVMLLKRGDEPAGVFTCERNRDTLSLYAGVGLAAPEHRGSGLAQAGLAFAEEAGRRMGLGFAYGMATLRAPYAQRAFERAGWQLIGITPGYDRELVAPGVAKRVYEAVYAKVLVGDAGLLLPQRQNMTPRTRAFFDRLFVAPQAGPPIPGPNANMGFALIA